MKILFLGDIVGNSGCEAVKKYLPEKIKKMFNKKPVILDPWDPMGALAK